MAELRIQLHNQNGDDLMPKTKGAIVDFQATRRSALTSTNVQGAIQELETLVAGVDSKVDENASAIGALDTLVAAVKTKAEANETEINVLKGRMDTAETAIEAVDDRVTVEAAKIAANTVEIGKNAGEIVKNAAAIAKNAGDIAQLRTDVTTIVDEKLVEVNESIEAVDTKADAIRTDLTSLEGEVSAIDGRVTVAEGQIVNLEAHASNADIHVTKSEKEKWNGYEAKIVKNEGDIAKLGSAIGAMERHFFVENQAELDALVAKGELKTGDLIHKLDTKQTFMFHGREAGAEDDEFILVSDFTFVGEHSHAYFEQAALKVDTTNASISNHTYELEFVDGKGGKKVVDVKGLVGVTYSVLA